MSCAVNSGRSWVNRHRPEGLRTRFGVRALAYTFLLGCVLATGCGSGVRGSDRSQGWYDRDSVRVFAAETGNTSRIVLEPEYVVGVGDLLEIVFLYHTNLTTRDLVVRRDGRISLPYVGDQMAAGYTPMVLDSLLEVRFSELLRDPNLSVIVKLPAPQKVYVMGQVRNPGRVEFDDELSMMQAVAATGGFEKGALSDHAVLIRRQGAQKIVGVEVDLEAVMSGEMLGNDLRLRNYDIIFIPKHPIYSAAEFMQAVNDIISAPLDLVYKGWQVANLSATYEYFRANNPVQVNGQ